VLVEPNLAALPAQPRSARHIARTRFILLNGRLVFFYINMRCFGGSSHADSAALIVLRFGSLSIALDARRTSREIASSARENAGQWAASAHESVFIAEQRDR